MRDINTEIAELLGVEGPAPDYCSDDTLSYDEMERLGAMVFTLPATPPNFKCVGELDGEVFVTEEYPDENQAAAEMLLLFLKKIKSAVTKLAK